MASYDTTRSTDMSDSYCIDERTPLRPRIKNRPSPGLKLSRKSKICYGVGGIPYQLTNTVLGFYINVFLLETARVPPFYTSAIVLTGRVWDAITDPLIGFLVFRTKYNSKFGKHKPWMFFATFPAVACYICFFITPDTTEPSYKLIWYMVFYCLFQTFLTFYQMPFATLTLCLTDNQKERDKATAFRMGSEVMGNLLGQLTMGLSLSLYQMRLEKVPECREFNDTATIPPEEAENKDQGYLVGASILSGMFLLCSMCAIFGTKEVLSPKRQTKYEESFGQALKEVITFGPWLKHIGFLIPFVLAVNAMQGNFALYSLYTLGMRNYQPAIILILVSAFVLMPFWRMCVQRFGKKLTLCMGLVPSAPLLVCWGIFPYGNVWIQYVLAILMGNVVAVVQLVPWTMVPDVIDDFLLKKKRGYEIIFYTFYTMIVKLISGLCIGITTFVLGVVKFKPGVCDVTEEVRLALRLLITCIPGGCIVFGLFFLYLYPITEEVRKQNQTILEIWRDAGDEKRRQTMKRSTEQRFRSKSMRTPTMSFSY